MKYLLKRIKTFFIAIYRKTAHTTISSISNQEKDTIYDLIFTYISSNLENWDEPIVLKQKSMESLGQLYYDQILSTIPKSSNDLINDIIQRIQPTERGYCSQKDYWVGLCKFLHIKRLPHTTYKQLETEYKKVFVQHFQSVSNKYVAEIARIDTELSRLEREKTALQSRVPSLSLVRDISSEEDRYREICVEHNKFRTRKEQISYCYKLVEKKLNTFCALDSPIDIEKKLRSCAVSLSKSDDDLSKVFDLYEDYLCICEHDIDKDYYLFHKVKLLEMYYRGQQKVSQQNISQHSHEKSIPEEITAFFKQIPSIEDLEIARQSNDINYLSSLSNLISSFSVLSIIRETLAKSISLANRSKILLMALELFSNKEYALFNSIIPIQIEGMFADYLYSSTTFLRFTHLDLFESSVLREKIAILDNQCEIDPEAVEYFSFYFSNLVRNRVAHGRYVGNSVDRTKDEILAKELLLDVNLLVHLIYRKSETEKMIRCIENYIPYCTGSDPTRMSTCYGGLYKDISGLRYHMDYDMLEQLRPLQFVYWIINPYYEKIFIQAGKHTEVLALRSIFYSHAFWQHVLNSLQHDITIGRPIHPEFKSVIKGMFNCGVSSDVKKLLAQVNSLLKSIG